MSVGCPLKEQPISSHIRVQCLLFLEGTLRDFYVPFARQVNESYSDQEKKLLARIIRLLTCRMEGQFFEPCLSCKFVRNKLIPFFCAQNYFRFTLSTGCPFSITTRTKCLHELAIRLRCFFVKVTLVFLLISFLYISCSLLVLLLVNCCTSIRPFLYLTGFTLLHDCHLSST